MTSPSIPQSLIDQTLSSIPPRTTPKLLPRHVYYVIGKPGTGKTSLARRLSEVTETRLVCPEDALKRSIEDDGSPNRQQLLEHLSNGGSITPEQIIKMMEQQVQSPDTKYKGYVIDGLPCNLNTKKQIDLDLLPLDMVVLTRFITDREKMHVPVLVELVMSDENLVRRRAGQWVDPVTNTGYAGQQVMYSRMRRAQGWKDGQPDEMAITESGTKVTGDVKDEGDGGDKDGDVNPDKPVGDGDAGDVNDDNDESSDTPDTVDDPKPKHSNRPAFTIKNKTTWPILSEEILNRLVKMPEDDPEHTVMELSNYAKYERAINEFRIKHFDTLHTIQLDATLHPDTLFQQLKTILESRNFSVLNKPVPAKRLMPPDTSLKGLADTDIIKYFSALNLEDGEPRRELGPYSTYCPVTYNRDNVLTEADMTICVSYRGYLYFFATESDAQMFVDNPDKYLSESLKVRDMRVVVLGGPVSGKSVISGLISKVYGVPCVSVDEILDRVVTGSGRVGSPSLDIKRLEMLEPKIQEKLRKGGVVPVDVLIDVIRYGLKQGDQRDTMSHGWVLDGFPQTAEQAKAMVAAGILPKHVVHILPDTSLQLSHDRARDLVTDYTGQPVTPGTDTAIRAYPFLDTMYQSHRTEIPDIHKHFDDAGTHFIEISATTPLPVSFTHLVTSMDPFIAQCVPGTHKPDPATDTMFGMTRDYCPVTLHTHNMMIKGNPAITVKYMSYTYHFVSDDARTEFCRYPQKYLVGVKIPPPRFIVMGPTGSGKTTCCVILGHKWGIPVVQYRTVIGEYGGMVSGEDQEEFVNAAKEGAAVPSHVLMDVMTHLFTAEPYASKGFILEGFPHTKLDLETTIKHNHIPDAYIVFKVDSDVAAKRALPARKRVMEAMKVESEKGRDVVDDVDEAASVGVSVNPSSQSDEELIDELLSSIEKDGAQNAEFVATIENISSVPVIEIDANKYIRPVMATLRKKLSKYLENRKSLLASATAISTTQADLLLKLGIKYYSPIGKYCPVTLRKTNKLSPENYGKKPVVYQDSIYFLKDAAAKREFLSNPLDYVYDSPPQPIVSPTVCVLGPPKSGKTDLCSKLADDLESVHLTIPSILQAILDGQEVSSLYDNLKKCLEAGETVPDHLVIEAVLLVTSRVINSGKGWILDGFPQTVEQAMALEKNEFIPHAFVQMVLDTDHIGDRAAKDFVIEMQNDTPRMSVPDIITMRNQEHANHITQIRDLFEDKYFNWVELDSNQSKWSLKETARVYIETGVQRRQNYLDSKSKNKAAPIWGIGLSKKYIINNLGKFKDYCPVSFVDSNELRKSVVPSPNMAEYREVFYLMHSKHELDKFLVSPDKYISDKELPVSLPEHRPRIDIKSLFPKQLELKGYCPVTYKEGPPGFSSIVLGSESCIVEYDNKLFAMKDETQLEKFMRTPWNYIDLVLPKKLPPPEAPIPISGLPTIGYLEQTVATSLTHALSAVGSFKPKYPYRRLSGSACEFLGLYLKAHNTRSKEWARKSYAKQLERFKSNCRLITSLVSELSGVDGYVPPENRPDGLDERLEAFIKLRTH